MHLDRRSVRRTEVEFQGEIKIPQELRSCRYYYTLLKRPRSHRGYRIGHGVWSSDETS